MKKLPKHVSKKAIDIIAKINNGSYHQFRGKRFTVNHNMITVPIGKKYRMICAINNGKTECLEILSHADYDNRIKSKKL